MKRISIGSPDPDPTESATAAPSPSDSASDRPRWSGVRDPTLTEKPGPHHLTVRFAGDEIHAGDADTGSFVVKKEDTALELSVEGEDDDKKVVARACPTSTHPLTASPTGQSTSTPTAS